MEREEFEDLLRIPTEEEWLQRFRDKPVRRKVDVNPTMYRDMEPFNEEWSINAKGSLQNRLNGYYIDSSALDMHDWYRHLKGKVWYDYDTFHPAFQEALRRAGNN